MKVVDHGPRDEGRQVESAKSYLQNRGEVVGRIVAATIIDGELVEPDPDPLRNNTVFRGGRMAITARPEIALHLLAGRAKAVGRVDGEEVAAVFGTDGRGPVPLGIDGPCDPVDTQAGDGAGTAHHGAARDELRRRRGLGQGRAARRIVDGDVGAAGVADDEGLFATRGRQTRVDGAGVVVVAVDGRTEAQTTPTGVVGGAGALVVAGAGMVDKHTAQGRAAAVVGTAIAIATFERDGARIAATGLAEVAECTGVLVITRQGVVDVYDADRRVAEVVGAGVVVVER